MEEIKEKIKQLLVENKCYVGNSEVAKMLRELAEWGNILRLYDGKYKRIKL